jgi:hypothetical protein
VLDQVRASDLIERHKRLIIAMLSKNRFGDDLWLSTESLQVIIGRVSRRRKTAGQDTRGRKLGNCERASRRAVQNWIDEAVRDEVLNPVYGPNVWVGRGPNHRVFRRSATYELNRAKLTRAETYDQWAARKRTSQPLARRFPPRNSSPAPEAATPAQPAVAASAPVPQSPAESQHRTLPRTPIARALSSRQAQTFVNKVGELMLGCNRIVALDGMGVQLQPQDARYRAPMSKEKALVSACMTLGVRLQDGEQHLKECCWNFDDWKRAHGIQGGESP